MAGRARRGFRAALSGGAALALLAGCQPGEFGLSGRDAEWSRRGDFSVVSASSGRAVVSARGQQVAVEPARGFCLDGEAIETSDRSAFVLIGDCALEAGSGAPGAGGELDLPGGMPGIITVSISGDPGFSGRGASDGDLSDLERYLATAEGRALLGRGGSGSQVSIVETRRQGGILYVLVEDRAPEAVALLAPRFWRAFVELNDRLAVVTVSGFRDVPMDEAQMLGHLGDQVRQLQVANAQPVDEAPVMVAAAPPRARPAETGSGDEVPVEIELVESGEAESTQAADEPAGADPAWAALAVADETADGEDGSGSLDLADAGQEGAEPTGAAGGPEVGWAGAAAFAGARSDPPTDPVVFEDLPEPGTGPVVVASTVDGRQEIWPMPSARPGARARTSTAAPAAAPVTAPADAPVPALLTSPVTVPVSMPEPRPETAAVSDMPLPPPRVADGTPSGAAVPLPPRARR